jgi:hypothetical protein
MITAVADAPNTASRKRRSGSPSWSLFAAIKSGNEKQHEKAKNPPPV